MDEETSVVARFKLSEKEKARRIGELKTRLEAATPGKRKVPTLIAGQTPNSRSASIALAIAAALSLTACFLLLLT
jgi:hypothetical protein